jgi:hypothetical protein
MWKKVKKTLEDFAFELNNDLGEKVFEVIDQERLINTKNRFEGNDIDITIEDEKYRFTITGETTYFDIKSPYLFIEYIIHSYKCMSEN